MSLTQKKAKGTNPHSFYYKLFFTLLALVLVIVCVLSTGFYFMFSSVLERKLFNEYAVGLDRVSLAFDNQLAEVEQAFRSLLLDSRADIFLSSDIANQQSHYLAYLNVRKIANVNPNFSSVCLVNTISGDWFETGMRGFNIYEGLSRIKPRNKRSIFRVTDQNGAGRVVVAHSEPNAEGFDYHVFFLLDADNIGNHILGNRSAFIINHEGKILLGNPNGLADMPWEEIYQRISQDNQSATPLRMELGIQDMLIVHDKDEATGIVYLDIRPYAELVAELRTQRNHIIFLSFAVASFCVVFALALAKYLYKPLKEVTTVFRSSKYAIDSQSGEFTLIADVYDKVVADIRGLEEQSGNYLPRIRLDFLRTMLFEDVNDTLFLKKSREYKIQISFANLFVACLHIDRFQIEDKSEEVVIVEKICVILADSFKEQADIEAIPESDGFIAILISVKDGFNPNGQEIIRGLEAARNLIIEKCHVLITIGLSSVCPSSSECPSVYSQAKAMIENRFVLGYNQIIHQGIVQELLSDILIYPEKLYKDILDCMKTDNAQGFEEGVDAFISLVKCYSVQSARLLYSQLQLECMKQYQQLSSGAKGITQVQTNGFLYLLTLNEGKQQLKGLFHDYRIAKSQIEALKSDKHYTVVNEAKSFIDQNFADVNLSMESLSERFGYSSNYFSRIFKSITDLYIADYIKQIRIHKAQELFTSTSLSVSEIAEKVGFTNTSYFYTSFKKETGLTPTSYRNMNSQLPS